ncbi:opsin, ultraviolet-sensitive-like isoform X1 [Vanessa tameamea]|uniref:Opsin, ultraviolet-sensitive-like isoform X1 n=1 Tax=Vanessa tameamea TaxID=334116 RepID=A0A8B8IKK8_VANTA|nr:opsin, ultraviolet-sensitive-like [Vanessa tameamea]
MSQAIIIIFIMFLVELECFNVDRSMQTKNEISMKSNKIQLKDSVINYFIYFDSLKCHGVILWRCFNLKMWKKRKRTNENNSLSQKLIRSRTKRFANEYGLGYEFHETISQVVTAEPMESMLVQRFKQKWPLNLWRQIGFTDDFVKCINPHWMQFPPPNPSLYYGIGGIYIVMVVMGSLGNTTVILMYCRCRTLRTPGNILVANLALSDFMMLAKTPIFIFNSFYLGPALGKPACVVYGFIGGLSGTTSIATLTAIALDRYWAVVYPLEPLRALTAIRARLLAVGAWFYAGFFAMIPALDIGYGHYVPEGFLTSCSFDYLTDEIPPRYFIFAFFCAGWLVPLCIISFCYTRILSIVVGKRNMNSKNQEQRLSSRHVKEQTKRKAELKLAVLVIVVIALFFVSWTPYAIISLLGIFGKRDVITPITSMIPALFCKTAACINPFIYIITHPKFKKELQKLLFRDKSRRMMGTFKTAACTETSKFHRQSKNLSETDVEIIEMKDIPYNVPNSKDIPNIETISSRISEREGSQKSKRSVSMKSFEESVITPPTWYSKPEFTKKKSFHRRLTNTSFDL